MLLLTPMQVNFIRAQAVAAGSDECCGILVGARCGPDAAVRETHAAPNVAGVSTCNYLLDPQTHLRVQRQCRERNLDIIGFYHSHSSGSAEPSARDVELAWPEHVYLIMAGAGTAAENVQAWRFSQRRIEEETLTVVL